MLILAIFPTPDAQTPRHIILFKASSVEEARKRYLDFELKSVDERMFSGYPSRELAERYYKEAVTRLQEVRETITFQELKSLEELGEYMPFDECFLGEEQGPL